MMMNNPYMRQAVPGPCGRGGFGYPSQAMYANGNRAFRQAPVEESYIENILRLNLGKSATIYMTFENNKEWNAKIFKGVLEAAGRDHIVVSDPSSGKRYLLMMINLDYVTFDEELTYDLPFGSSPPMSSSR